jgi:hypothetical protein
MFVVVMVATCDLARGSSEQLGGEDQVVKEDWYIGPRIGISWYTGIIGLEIQHHHFAFTAGIPEVLGVKYYLKPDGHSWFVGGHFMNYSFKKDSGDKKRVTEGGAGFGYRWRWGTGWDLDLHFGLAYGEEKETIGLSEITTKYLGIRPGISMGYSF